MTRHISILNFTVIRDYLLSDLVINLNCEFLLSFILNLLNNGFVNLILLIKMY